MSDLPIGIVGEWDQPGRCRCCDHRSSGADRRPRRRHCVQYDSRAGLLATHSRAAGRPTIDIRLISIVEAAEHLSSRYAPESRIGVLGTASTVATNIYGPALARRGFAVHYPGEAQVAAVHRAIYDPRFGIKSHFDPVPDAARREVEDAIVGLAESGVEAVVLGCTELPFAVSSAAKWARAGAGSGAAARARARRSGGAGALALRPDQSRNDAYFGARMAALSSS